MRFATISADGVNQAAVAAADTWVPLHHIDDSLRGDILVLIGSGLDTDRLAEIQATADQVQNKFRIPFSEATYGPPYRRPRMIWGIGLNYSEHAQDLDEGTPDQPASFIKGDHTVIGPGEDIVIPRASTHTTAEAELGLIIGKTARYVSEAEAMDHVFGVCAILDQTAEDILALNPRYLTRSKNFPTFFSYGPEVVTVDELPVDDLAHLSVQTVIDGSTIRKNVVANMTHSPASIIAFHSQMMPLLPGDIISTGTPGAGMLSPGVVAEAHIDGLLPLRNPVIAE